MSAIEIAANLVTAFSIWLAARNSAHTWTTGLLGCVLFGVQFFQSQLYADATLQVFFFFTSIIGWAQWRQRRGAAPRRITRVAPKPLAWMAAAALTVTLVYGWLLHRFTDAFMPFVDAGVLALSVVAQCLLMQRKLQTWPWWLAVNTLSVPLFASRGLWLTAALYGVYWVNAWYGWWHWRREAAAPESPGTVTPA
ncbi:nicotinamide riboside transporter PnuC [Ideonella sp.]|uniref:nicotinamide riboside transporter PnuC n=1 Tax=Ideonella sp. TaxID=1929293 RepID=UPI003BB5F0BB